MTTAEFVEITKWPVFLSVGLFLLFGREHERRLGLVFLGFWIATIASMMTIA